MSIAGKATFLPIFLPLGTMGGCEKEQDYLLACLTDCLLLLSELRLTEKDDVLCKAIHHTHQVIQLLPSHHQLCFCPSGDSTTSTEQRTLGSVLTFPELALIVRFKWIMGSEELQWQNISIIIILLSP